jgi:hypothetical protein
LCVEKIKNELVEVISHHQQQQQQQNNNNNNKLKEISQNIIENSSPQANTIVKSRNNSKSPASRPPISPYSKNNKHIEAKSKSPMPELSSQCNIDTCKTNNNNSEQNRHHQHVAYLHSRHEQVTTSSNNNNNSNHINADSSGEHSDDDVLHVVTNVYTIPISNNNNSNSNAIELNGGGGGGVEVTHKTTEREKRIVRRVIDATKSEDSDNLLVKSNLLSNNSNDLTQKSKFQIRSIVEVYERDDDDDDDLGDNNNENDDDAKYTTNTKVEETTIKEYVPVKGNNTTYK